MATITLSATAFKNPPVALSGVVDYSMYVSFRQQFDNDCRLRLGPGSALAIARLSGATIEGLASI
jgi:hypothetical protein